MEKHLEFFITYTCPYNCVFCTETLWMRKSKWKFFPTKEIKKRLILRRRQGFTIVKFVGGEPTLHPDFLEILKFSKKLKYKTGFPTNGLMLARLDFCKTVVPFLDEISFSIHGHNAKTHDKLVGKSGAFNNVIRAIKNLDLGKSVDKFANIVVVKDNFRNIEKIFDFLHKYNFEKVLLSNMIPADGAGFKTNGLGYKNFGKLTVRLQDWKKRLPQIIKKAKLYNISIQTSGLPICILKKYKFLSNDFLRSAKTWADRSAEKKISIETISEYPSDATTVAIKTKVCENCRYEKICLGIFEEYYKIFGDKELKPFRN